MLPEPKFTKWVNPLSDVEIETQGQTGMSMRTPVRQTLPNDVPLKHSTLQNTQRLILKFGACIMPKRKEFGWRHDIDLPFFWVFHVIYFPICLAARAFLYVPLG